jgi:hypothetical protein
MKRNTFAINSEVLKPVTGKGWPFLYGVLLLLLAAVLLSSCSMPEKTPSSEPVIPEPSEFTYSVSISAAPIQISSGNLHWHKELPNESYTLEDMALEIYNLGDLDILVAQLEIRVDDDTRLFNIDRVIPGGERENIVLQPIMEGYDGGAHRVYVALLDHNGGVLYRNKGEDIGPLEPIPGTGSWKPVPNQPATKVSPEK